MTHPGNQLAAVVATRRTMPFKRASDSSANSFEGAAATLLRLGGRGSSQAESLWELATDLSELGFCEVEWSTGQARIHATRPVLAVLPSQQPGAILCGARTAVFVDRFRAACREAGAKETPPAVLDKLWPEGMRPLHRDLLPTVIRIQADARESFQTIAASCIGLTCPAAPPAWACLHAAPSLSDFESARASYFRNQNPAFLSHMDWLNFKNGRWQRLVPGKLPAGPLFFARSTDHGTKFALGRLGEDGSLSIDPGDASFDARWAKWLVLARAGAEALLHDDQRKRLAIPRLCPLPALLGRALALCSGLPAAVWRREIVSKVPESLPGTDLRVYSEIPDVFAHILGRKLGIAPRLAHLELPVEALQNSLAPALH